MTSDAIDWPLLVELWVKRRSVTRWADDRQEYFTNALEAENVQALKIEHFTGEAAFPDKQKAVEVR